MRMRRKKWARPELAVCPYYIENAEKMKGKWHTAFENNDRPLYAEFGCGKGVFVGQAAFREPDVNWIAVDIKSEMLAVGRRTVEKIFKDSGRRPEDNIRLVSHNISMISDAFAPEDVVDRIYINFCNPWNRGKHNKRRLTHIRQLMQYRAFLKDGGEIRFKTDDDQLFDDSVEYFKECGFDIIYMTRDLHADNLPENIMTEHEKMFSDEGINIKCLYAVKGELTHDPLEKTEDEDE